MIAVDTNLLVYAHRTAVPEHRRARDAIQAAADDPRGWGIVLSSLLEFWAVVTHPSAPRPSTPKEVTSFIATLIDDGGAAIWFPGAGFHARLLRSATDLRVSGARIFDLQIGLVALENGAREIWTHDRGFVTPPGLRLVNPLA